MKYNGNPFDSWAWGYCDHCHRDIQLDPEGLIREHHSTADKLDPCPGSGDYPTDPPPEMEIDP